MLRAQRVPARRVLARRALARGIPAKETSRAVSPRVKPRLALGLPMNRLAPAAAAKACQFLRTD